NGKGISPFLHSVYFVQFSMSQKRRKGAKFMPENEVFGQAGGVEVIFWKMYDTFLLCGDRTMLQSCANMCKMISGLF
ncbi:hypothetical protein, partial [Eubacterium sp. An3]|uniref:hypothetical protein n=1 Tax=Eubacterium sp. An3 TaxID=1965628 RepID=UPI000B575B3C